MTRYLTFIVLLMIVTASQAFCDSVDYGRTHALIVGVLCWKDSEIAPFSAENRKDLEIAEALKARGVPGDHERYERERSPADSYSQRRGPGPLRPR